MFLFQSSADYDTGFSVSAQCFRKDDPVTPYTSCTWMLVTSIQLCIFTFNSYKKFSSPRGIKYKSSQIELGSTVLLECAFLNLTLSNHFTLIP